MCLVFLLMWALIPCRSTGTIYGWSGSANQMSNLWVFGGNWTNNNGGVPLAGDTALFGAGGFSNLVGIRFSFSNQNVGQIFLAPGSTVDRTIGNASTGAGGNLSLYGIDGVLLTNAVSGRTLTLTTKVLNGVYDMTNVLAGSGDIGVAAGANIFINNWVTENGGARSLKKTGSGLLVLNANNATYAGTMTVAQGQLQIGHSNALGTAAGNTTVSNGAELYYATNGMVMVEPLVLSGSGINGGALRIGSNSGVTNQGAITLSGDTAIKMDSGSWLQQNGDLTGPSYQLTLQQAGAFTSTFNGKINAQSLTKGPGDNTAGATVILAASNSLSRVTNSLGGLVVRHNYALGNTSAVYANCSSNDASYTGTRIQLENTVTIPSTVSLALSSSGSLRSSLFSTNGNNIWNGPITLSGDGGCQLYGNASGGLVLNSAVSGSCGTLFVRGNGSGELWGPININVTPLKKVDPGTWTLFTNNHTMGMVQIGEGTLRLGTNQALMTGNAVMLGYSNATVGILDLNGFAQTVSDLELAPGTTGACYITNGSPTLDSILTYAGGTNNAVYAGTIRDSARRVNLAVTSGTLVLTADNSAYNGNISVTGGSLQVGHSNALGNAIGGTIVTNSGELCLASNRLLLAEPLTVGGGVLRVADSAVVTNLGALTLAASATIQADSNSILHLNGLLQTLGSNCNLTKNGPGTLVLNASNAAYDGVITVSGGVLQVGHTNALGLTNSGTIVTNGGELYYALNRWLSLEPLTLSGTGVNGGALHIGNASTITNAANILLGSNATIWVDAASMLYLNGDITNSSRHLTFVANGSSTNLINGRIMVASFTKGIGDSGTAAVALCSSNALNAVTNRMGAIIGRTNNAFGSSGSVRLEFNTNDASMIGTSIQLDNYISIPSGVALYLSSTNQNGVGYRSSLYGRTSTNTWGGTINLSGNDICQLYAESSQLTINGQINGACSNLFLRGAKYGELRGTVNIANTSLKKMDASVWALYSTINTTGLVQICDGTLRLNANQVFTKTNALIFGQGTGSAGVLDMNGYSLTVPGLALAPGSNGLCIIANSNQTTTTDSQLTFVGGTNISVFSGTVRDVARSVKISVASGTLFLAGTNLCIGDFSATGGRLAVTRWSASRGSYFVSPGGTFIFQSLTASDSITISNLSLRTAGNATNEFALGTFGNRPVAPLVITNALTNLGTLWINVDAGNLSTGQFPLIQYGLRAGNGTYALGRMPRGYNATLVDNVTNQSIDLLITKVPTQDDYLKWNGNPNGNWDIAGTANWKTNGVSTVYPELWQPGEAVLFDDSLTGTTNVILTTNVSPAQVTINNTNVDYVFTGPGKLTGSTILTKSGPGTLILATTSNDYTGTTIIQSGTLRVAATNAIPSDPTQGGVTVNGTLDLGGYNATLNNLSGTGIVDTTIGTGTNILTLTTVSVTNLFAGIIQNSSGMLALTKTGNGTLALTGNNTNSGLTTLNGGTLQIGTGGTDGTLGPAAISVTISNTALVINRSGTYTLNTNIYGSATARPNLVLTGPGTTILTGSTDNAYTFATVQNGTLVLAKPNVANVRALSGGYGTFSNVINNGTLCLGAQADQIATSNMVFLNTNGIFDLAGFNEGFDILNGFGMVTNGLTGSLSTLTLGESNGSNYFAGTLIGNTFGGGDLKLVKMGTGTLTLAGTNSLKGGIVVSNGAVAFASEASLGGDGNAISLAGGTLQTFGTNQIRLDGHFLGTLGSGNYLFNVVDPLANLLVTNSLIGTSMVVKNGAGTLSLFGNNTYSGTNVFNGGRVLIQQDAQLGVVPGSARTNLWFNGGTLAMGGTFDVNSNRHAYLQGNGGFEIANDATSTYAGIIRGTGAFIKSGGGTLVLSYTNNYTGGTVISNGILSVDTLADSVASGIGLSGTITFSGGTLRYTGAAATTARAFTNATGGTIDLPSGNLTLQGSFNGNPTSTVSKTGSGTLYLSGSTGKDNTNLWFNVIQGITVLDKSDPVTHSVSGIAGVSLAATVRLAGAANHFMLIDTNLNCGVTNLNGTLDLNGRNAMFELLSGSGMISNSAALPCFLTNGTYGSSTLYSGAIHDGMSSVGLVKAGSGTLSLNGTTPSTFSGGVALLAGVLQVANSGNLGASTINVWGGSLTMLDGFSTSNALFLNSTSENLDVPVGTANWNGPLTIASTGQLRLRSSGIDRSGTLVIKAPVNFAAGTGFGVNSGKLAFDGTSVSSSAPNGDTVGTDGWAAVELRNNAAYSATGGLKLLGDFFSPAATFSVRDTALATLPWVDLNYVGGYYSVGTVNLDGGVLVVNQIQQSATGFGQQGLMYFNGGMLRARVSTATFMQGLTAAYVRDGGAIIDSAGYDITIAQPLLAAGTGGLTKTGLGTLILPAVNTYRGTTVVNGGRLLVAPTTKATSGILVNHGAVFGLSAVVPGISFTATNLVLGTNVAAATALEFNFLGDTNQPAMQITGTLSVQGTNTIHVLSGGLRPGRYPLIRYGVLTGAGLAGFKLGALPARVLAAGLDHDTNTHTILLVVTNASVPKWAGRINNNWDIGTANWLDSGSGLPTAYQQTNNPGDAVWFDDSATLSGVNLATNVAPAGITVSNSTLPYIFSGPGRLSGSTWLSKSGTGVLLLNGAHDYNGGTRLQSGTLIANDAGAVGSGPVILQGGILQVAGGLHLTNDLMVPENAVAAITNDSGVNFWDGNVSGSGTLRVGSVVQAWLQGDNHEFAGTISLLSGDLRLVFPESSSALAVWDAGTNRIGFDSPGWYCLGELRGDAASSVRGYNGVAQTVEIGARNTDSAFNGPITRHNASSLAVVKTGSGQFTMGGNNNVDGVTVSNGMLLVNGSLQASGVTVMAGALGGMGFIYAPVAIQSDGRFDSGTNVGPLFVYNTLSLQGASMIKVRRTGGALANDGVAGMSTVTYGGTLTVTNVGEPLQAGDSIRLFEAGEYFGTFTATNLPPLEPALFWDTSQLGSSGVLTVQGAPYLTIPSSNRSVTAGTPLILAPTVSGSDPMAYQWFFNQNRLNSQTNASLFLSAAFCADAGSYYVIASNRYGLATSAVIQLTVSNPPPVIVQSPLNLLVNEGSNALLTANASNVCGIAACQWFFQTNQPLPDQTGTSLVLSNVTFAQSGGYAMVASNAAGCATSAVAMLTVNRLPVASNDSVTVSRNQTLSIPAYKLLANDSDADGDILTLTSVSPVSTNGGGVSLAGGMVYYTPVSNYSGGDRFSYTISDGRGGIAGALVYVTVLTNTAAFANEVTTPVLSNGVVTVTFAGIPGRTVLFQCTTDLQAWITLQTNTVPSHGVITLVDTNPPSGSAWYRTVQP